MPFKSIVVILALIAITSCKKQSFLSGPDHISFHEFNPAPEITSVDSFTYSINGKLPNPNDSSATYSLDIDDDSTTDFQLTVKHWYAFVSASDPSANQNYEMSVSGIGEDSEVATIEKTPDHARFYNDNESIDPKAEWKNSSKLWHTGGFADSYYISFTGTQYVGLRIKNGSRRNYCWLKINRNADEHKLTILSFGYNKSHGNNILAGQQN